MMGLLVSDRWAWNPWRKCIAIQPDCRIGTFSGETILNRSFQITFQWTCPNEPFIVGKNGNRRLRVNAGNGRLLISRTHLAHWTWLLSLRCERPRRHVLIGLPGWSGGYQVGNTKTMRRLVSIVGYRQVVTYCFRQHWLSTFDGRRCQLIHWSKLSHRLTVK